MTDLTTTIAAKSDQLNADDLIGGPKTITVTGVSLLKEADQPIAINYEGDGGKPFKPCKTMRRLLVTLWLGNGNAYAGRRMTLYRDGTVQFGGLEVGGIRISHMSDIEGEITVALNAKRGMKKPYKVKPLSASKPSAAQGRPAANNGRAEGTASTPIVERVKKAADALMSAESLESVEKIWGKTSPLKENLQASDQADHLMTLTDAYTAAKAKWPVKQERASGDEY